jgi:hypothetical protein
MLHSIENTSIGLGIEPDTHENSFYSWIQVLEAKDAIFPNLLQRPKPIQWLVVAVVCWLPFIIGTYFRFFLYEYLLQQYKKKELLPVNVLSLVVVSTDHLSRLSGTLTATLFISNAESGDRVDGGYWFCTAQILYTYFSAHYSIIGSLGVSIYRILLIKHNNFLKDVMGEKVMLNLILYGGILLALLFTMMVTTNDYQKLAFNTCTLIPKLQVLEILDEYEQSRGYSSIMSYYNKVVGVDGIVMTFMVISEIIIYVVFFYHMYKHDNNDRLRRVLELKVIKGRNRKNAITFIGQFCSFVVEFTGLLLLVGAFTIGTRDNKLPLIAIVFRSFSFPIMSMVEALTSDVLRKRLFKIELYNIIFGLN